MTTTSKIIARHDRHMILNYPRFPIALDRGKGSKLVDADGKQYLDLFSGFGAGILGHCHDDLVAAVTRQANKLWHVGNLLHTEPQTLLAEQIAGKGFGGRSYFCHSGSDANEAAFKLARLHGRGKRYKIIATENSFHGRGFASMVATGQKKIRKGFEPLMPGFVHVPYNDLDAMAKAVDDETIAIIVEPIQGEGGVVIPDEKYLPGLRKLCDEHDLMLILDEVWTGCGRTGKWFAYQHGNVEPDVLTLGKAVGVGLGVGVMCASEKFGELFDVQHYGGVPHATTLGGNCLAMAASARMFEVIERDGLLDRAAKLGKEIIGDLRRWAKKNPVIKQVRGRGLFIGIEIDPSAAGCPHDDAAGVVKACFHEGVMLNATQQVVLRLAPPLVVTDEEIEHGLNTIKRVLTE